MILSGIQLSTQHVLEISAQVMSLVRENTEFFYVQALRALAQLGMRTSVNLSALVEVARQLHTAVTGDPFAQQPRLVTRARALLLQLNRFAQHEGETYFPTISAKVGIVINVRLLTRKRSGGRSASKMSTRPLCIRVLKEDH